MDLTQIDYHASYYSPLHPLRELNDRGKSGTYSDSVDVWRRHEGGRVKRGERKGLCLFFWGRSERLV